MDSPSFRNIYRSFSVVAVVFSMCWGSAGNNVLNYGIVAFSYDENQTNCTNNAAPELFQSLIQTDVYMTFQKKCKTVNVQVKRYGRMNDVLCVKRRV